MDDDFLEGISMMLWWLYCIRKFVCLLELIVVIVCFLDMFWGRSMLGKGLGSDVMVIGLLRDVLVERL